MIWQNLATWQTEVLHAHICTLASVAQMHVRLLFPSDPHKDLFLPSLIFCSRSSWVSSCDMYVALLLQIYPKDVVLSTMGPRPSSRVLGAAGRKHAS